MGKKLMVAQIYKGNEDEGKWSSSEYILEKDPTDLCNRLDMIGEGDGKVEDDPQVLDLHDFQKVVFMMESQSELETTGQAQVCGQRTMLAVGQDKKGERSWGRKIDGMWSVASRNIKSICINNSLSYKANGIRCYQREKVIRRQGKKQGVF